MFLAVFDEAMRSEWLPEWLCAAGHFAAQDAANHTTNMKGAICLILFIRLKA
jgi:hypothetical protein